MSRKIIDIGTIGNDGTGDSIRDSFRKVNDNFRELYSSLGLGDRLTFLGLSDAPGGGTGTYEGQEGAVLTVNDTASGIRFKQLKQGTGIRLDTTTNENEITINTLFAAISGDPNPQLGGPLNALSGGDRYPIGNLPNLNDQAEYEQSVNLLTSSYGGDSAEDGRLAVNKGYADSKIALAGVEAVDPQTGNPNPQFGTMTGPLILSRDPVDADDEVYDGLIAATKRYVDNSAFGSVANLYVAKSGQDERPGVSLDLQGRALAYAYKTIEAALKRAEELVLESKSELGPYKKVLTYGGYSAGTVVISQGTPALFTATNHGLAVDAAITFTTTGELPSELSTDATYYVVPAGLTANTFRLAEVKGGDPLNIISENQTGTHSFRGFNVSKFNCTLSSISEAPSGSNFAGSVYMSVDTIEIWNPLEGGRGNTYRVGDLIELAGSYTGTPAKIEVLSTIGNPGAISTFRLISQGVYSELPGSTAIPTTRGTSELGSGAKFNVTYKVNKIDVTNGGTGYGLVSVRIIPAEGDTTGSGAFGIADVVNTSIVSITVTDPGNGFTDLPSVVVSLPRFKIFTNGKRTDYTGNVLSSDRIAARSRDIREGLYLRGETTGALAQILSHSGSLDGLDEVFDVDIKYGSFQVGEEISYGDVTKNIQISVLIESGIYEENYPLKIPQNVAIIGDEFRRVLIKPRPGISSSPWSFQHFRRDTQVDSITVAEQNFGYHYLTDPTNPVFPMIDNKGAYRSAAQLISLNKGFLQGEVIAWIENQIFNNIGFWTNFEYDAVLCSRDVGLIIDAMIFDLKYGLYNRTVSAALKYKSNASGLKAITDQLSQTRASLEHLNTLIQDVITNTEITPVYSTIKSQIIDFAFISEAGAGDVIQALFDTLDQIISDSNSVNYPLDNDKMDVFLCNDANIIRAVTCHGHGGFMMVLDPEGQILAKSPYAQECASFSKSIGSKTFSGGMFVDGFTGNLKFQIISIESPTFLRVGNLKRMPNLPASFIVNDVVYRINYVRDFTFYPEGSTASFILDETTPWPFELFTYNEAACNRDVGLILEGLGYDIALGTNYNARKAGLTYRQSNAAEVVSNQLAITKAAIAYTHNLARQTLANNETASTIVDYDEIVLTNILDNGSSFAADLTFTNPPGVSANIVNAKELLLANKDYMIAEVTGWIAAQIAGPFTPFTSGFTYEVSKCERDIEYIVEAVVYDILYGGNTMTIDAGLKYYDGVFNAETFFIPTQKSQTVAAFSYLIYLAQQVVLDSNPDVSYSAIPRTSGTPASATETARIQDLIDGINAIILSGPSSAPTLVPIDLEAYSYDTTLLNAKTLLDGDRSSIQTQVIGFVNENANSYEVLMPGNRSMLANDFTQVNDMGYGLLVTNGALLEAVSVFTYYCHISYYAVNGGQIRSVGGSSSHGNFALVAEGSDPLEIPTPVTLYYDLSQGAEIYAPGGLFTNEEKGLTVYIANYNYVPLALSELEVVHTDNKIYRYSVDSVDTSTGVTGVVKLNISSTGNTTTSGLAFAIPDGTKITIRQNSQVVLTGDVVEVATRPSTALKLNETTNSVYRVLQFEEFIDDDGTKTATVTPGTEGIINVTGHNQLASYLVTFTSTGTLPGGITAGIKYFVVSNDLTPNSFKISLSKNGTPLEITSTGTGILSVSPAGLARTTLRENYDYVDITIAEPNILTGTPKTFTVNIANPATFTSSSHGLVAGDIISFSTTGSLPNGLSSSKHFFVLAAGLTGSEFRVSLSPNGTAVGTTGSQSGTHTWSKVKGLVGDSSFAIVALGPNDESRVVGTKFTWIGESYTITGYDNPLITGQIYGIVYLDRPLVDSVINFESVPSVKAGIQSRTLGAAGTLTIRIALTRVTSHDLLEIGTGSYADTNYPNEIYGPPVNALSEANETAERGEGRVFYVTTDQWGNFKVGPYFKVDQGTGRVTFAAAIALSNLDGIGFKRGVPIAEFSVDSSMGDNATDTVPTENAVRTYIDRRLGISHTGSVIATDQRIPSLTGGFLPVDGSLSMIGNIDVNNNRVINVDDPTGPQDAVNLRSLILANLQDFSGTNIRANDLFVFTGVGKQTTNASVVGDISFNIDSTANTIDAQISPGVITNSDINSSAAIDQSKLAMNSATTRATATGIVQGDRGLASFDNTFFEATNGWITLKDGVISLAKLQNITSKTVIGRGDVGPGVPAAVSFSDVTAYGGSIRKSQWGSGVGYLKKYATGIADDSSTSDSKWQMVEDSSSNVASTLVRRDPSGWIAAGETTFTNVSLQLDTETSDVLVLSRVTSLTGGTTRLAGFNGNGGIILGTGPVGGAGGAGDNITTYANDRHDFRTQSRNNLAPVVCSTVYATALSSGDPTSGGDTVAGTITGQWVLASSPGASTKGNSRLQATYAADLAEFYEGDKEYDVGTVLVFGGEKEVTTSSIKADSRVAGVVSNNAAYSMYGACPGFKNQIALQGRVPCKVVGTIRKGDLITTSGIPGVAGLAKDPKPGTLIGKALQDYDSDHIGTIEVAVGRV